MSAASGRQRRPSHQPRVEFGDGSEEPSAQRALVTLRCGGKISPEAGEVDIVISQQVQSGMRELGE